MSIHRTHAGASIALILALAAMTFTGCEPEPTTVNLSAGDGAAYYAGVGHG